MTEEVRSYTATFPWLWLTASITVVGADAGTLEDLRDYAGDLAARWDESRPGSELRALMADRHAESESAESRLLSAVLLACHGLPISAAVVPALAVDLIAAEADDTDANGWWIRLGPAGRAAGACPVGDGWRFDLPDAGWVSVRAGAVALAAPVGGDVAYAAAPHAWMAMRAAYQQLTAPFVVAPIDYGPDVTAWLIPAGTTAARA
ncbi:MAG: hypothetical protein QOK14_889 [Frankiaceae bacterium]|nr:hypothetical protein [Frankiaceae bacterium]